MKLNLSAVFKTALAIALCAMLGLALWWVFGLLPSYLAQFAIYVCISYYVVTSIVNTYKVFASEDQECPD